MSEMLEVRNEQTLKMILQNNTAEPVLLIAKRMGCPECTSAMMQMPAIMQASPKVIYFRVDTDDLREALKPYDIKYVPTFILFRNGQEIFRTFGSTVESMEALQDALKAA